MTADVELERYPDMAHDVDQMIVRHIERNREYARIFNKGSELDKLAGIPIKTPNDNLRHVIGIKGGSEYSVHSFLTLGPDVYVLRSSGVLSDTVKEVMRRNESIVTALRARQENDIPVEAGVCIDGAFTPQNPTFENIELGFRLAEFPDVHFSISLIKQGDDPEPQEEFFRRHEDALQDRRDAGYGDLVDKLKFLRKGPRTLNGWTGDELLIHFPLWQGTPEAQQFTFWSTGKANDAWNPQVDIVLDTGVKENKTHSMKTSLTDDEALELWERLLNSIRVRPVNKPTMSVILSHSAHAITTCRLGPGAAQVIKASREQEIADSYIYTLRYAGRTQFFYGSADMSRGLSVHVACVGKRQHALVSYGEFTSAFSKGFVIVCNPQTGKIHRLDFAERSPPQWLYTNKDETLVVFPNNGTGEYGNTRFIVYRRANPDGAEAGVRGVNALPPSRRFEVTQLQGTHR